jgi:hypothetical protein
MMLVAVVLVFITRRTCTGNQPIGKLTVETYMEGHGEFAREVKRVKVQAA